MPLGWRTARSLLRREESRSDPRRGTVGDRRGGRPRSMTRSRGRSLRLPGETHSSRGFSLAPSIPWANPWASRSRAVRSSIKPARALPRTAGSSRRSRIWQSIPARSSTLAANRPAGPAPTIPTAPTDVSLPPGRSLRLPMNVSHVKLDRRATPQRTSACTRPETGGPERFRSANPPFEEPCAPFDHRVEGNIELVRRRRPVRDTRRAHVRVRVALTPVPNSIRLSEW